MTFPEQAAPPRFKSPGRQLSQSPLGSSWGLGSPTGLPLVTGPPLRRVLAGIISLPTGSVGFEPPRRALRQPLPSWSFFHPSHTLFPSVEPPEVHQKASRSQLRKVGNFGQRLPKASMTLRSEVSFLFPQQRVQWRFSITFLASACRIR